MIKFTLLKSQIEQNGNHELLLFLKQANRIIKYSNKKIKEK